MAWSAGDSGFTDTYHGAMQSAIHQQKHWAILYDADHLPRPSNEWLQAEHWSSCRAIGSGRGANWLIATPWGPAVLKQYRRGGWMAPLLQDAYVFQGWQRTRSWHEWRVLAHLFAHGLPVPQPWLAGAQRHGRFYRCGLITGHIAARPLSELEEGRLAQRALWQAVGKLIQRFCHAGVHHADLNLSNILCDEHGKLFLLDFDRARLCPGQVMLAAPQVRRLLRSYQRFLSNTSSRMAATQYQRLPGLDQVQAWLVTAATPDKR